MKAFIAMALLSLMPVVAPISANASPTPSYDSCATPSLHGVWDCR